MLYKDWGLVRRRATRRLTTLQTMCKILTYRKKRLKTGPVTVRFRLFFNLIKFSPSNNLLFSSAEFKAKVEPILDYIEDIYNCEFQKHYDRVKEWIDFIAKQSGKFNRIHIEKNLN